MKYNLTVFNDESILTGCIKETTLNYRAYDPGIYLYKLIFNYTYEEKFSDEFIELVYATLCAWNMNSRAAELTEFEDFKKSILENKELFDYFKEYNLSNFTEISNLKKLQDLFTKLKLCKQNAKLVTHSKTMHFFLPDLFVPIDRTYTVQFFRGYTTNLGSLNEQIGLFLQYHVQFSNFAKEKDLKKYIDDKWNKTIPKVIDNAIIGFLRLKNKVS